VRVCVACVSTCMCVCVCVGMRVSTYACGRVCMHVGIIARRNARHHIPTTLQQASTNKKTTTRKNKGARAKKKEKKMMMKKTKKRDRQLFAYLLENMLCFEKTWIDLLRRQIATTNHEDLRGRLARGTGACGVHMLKKLLHHPQQSVVILTTEHFTHKHPAWLQEFGGQLQRPQHQLVLHIRITVILRTNVRSTIIQHTTMRGETGGKGVCVCVCV
jgi:hypothetical protein